MVLINQLYPLAKQQFLSAGINMMSDTIKVALLDLTKYTFSSSHQYLSDLVGGSGGDPRIGTDQTLTNKSVTNGIFNAAATVVPSVTGNPVEGLLLYKSTGTNSTSNLILFVDTGSGAGIALIPNGTNITISWDTSANQIFAL